MADSQQKRLYDEIAIINEGSCIMRSKNIFIIFFLTLFFSVNSTLAQTPHMDGESLYADVVQYAEYAPHRTATQGDLDTAQWIAGELEAAGLVTQIYPWPVRQYFLEESNLKIAGESVDSFPFWYPKDTESETITAPLAIMTNETGPGELSGRIAFYSWEHFDFPGALYFGPGVNQLALQAKEAGALALVVTAPADSYGLAAINAREPYHQSPLPLPAVAIGIQTEVATVNTAAQAGETASLFIKGTDNQNAEAKNVIGRLERGDRYVVVSTPISGWFECAGERGPGVVLFLGLARWAAQSDSDFSYLFLANSGHELDNMGAHFSLSKFAPKTADVATWIHLGASIATRQWEMTDAGPKPLAKVNDKLSLTGVDDLVPVLEDAFADAPGYDPYSASEGRVAGELRHFIDSGYRAFGIFGGHFFFHTRNDTPATTGPEFLEPVGQALVKVIQELETMNLD